MLNGKDQSVKIRPLGNLISMNQNKCSSVGTALVKRKIGCFSVVRGETATAGTVIVWAQESPLTHRGSIYLGIDAAVFLGCVHLGTQLLR